jgi:glycosyltransferase involved in cell wall biosynthesis
MTTPPLTDLDVRLQPLVSVVIPAFNAAQTLSETIRSVLAQTYAPIEIVVVDDGSTDDTAQVLDSFGSTIKCVRKPNGGLASARNAGCAAAQGEYIALLDADDLCTPQRIAVQIAVFKAAPDIVLACSDFDAFGADGTNRPLHAATYYSAVREAAGGFAGLFPVKQQLQAAPEQAPLVLHTGTLYPVLALGNVVHPPTCMFRRGLFTAVGGFDESIRNMCDWDWLVRASRCGAFGYIEASLLRYRLSETQLSGSKHHVTAMLDIVKVFELIARRDPQLKALLGRRFAQKLNAARIWAADAMVEKDARAALRYLLKALPTGLTDRLWIKTLLKCLLPKPLVNLAKTLKHQH